jgi:hypothetical protein
MITKWRLRERLQKMIAAKGKGIPIPYSGRNRYKPAPKWTDDDWGHVTRTNRWRVKNLAKVNNRDERRGAL